ncbi:MULTISPECIES: Cro/Cl family transcriptional regulator [Lactobacillaceae]|uniref:Cro/Cl family transcriptional regulator n=1 Tax=Lactobacillaceae TaxID=33958 RepID=UPI001456E153|nr:Cro/Cl family transcriptional regulator [Lactobacillus sp. HBUAS51381]NLR09062.1 Cro/Cl family transcriptional regulator [Lactobacillus sp. HBUAS51381]
MNNDIDQIVNWFRVKSSQQMQDMDADELSRGKVSQLLYYVQGICVVVYGIRAFSDELVAGEHGVMIPAVEARYAGQTSIVGRLTAEDQADHDYLAGIQQFQAILECVWQTFGDLSAVELMERVQCDQPWAETLPGNVIEMAAMEDYFKDKVIARIKMD